MRPLLLVLLSTLFLTLTGCEGWTQIMSNKNPDSIIPQNDPTGTKNVPQCDQWCHNGWCSTHCKNTKTGS